MDTRRDAIVKSGVRSGRLKNEKGSDGAVNESDTVDTLKATVSTKDYQSAIARYLSSISGSAEAY